MTAPRMPPSKTHALLKSEGVEPGFSPVDPIKKQRDNREWRIQADFFRRWRREHGKLGIPQQLLFHIANGGALGEGKERWQVKGRLIRGNMLKLAGLTAGIPDVFFAVPVFAIVRPNPDPLDPRWILGGELKFAGMFLEFKTPEGVESPEQKLVFPILRERGYKVVVCRSADEGWFELTQYLSS